MQSNYLLARIAAMIGLDWQAFMVQADKHIMHGKAGI